MNSWTIEGYELAVMQALNEGFCSKAFDLSSLKEKGLCKESNDRFILTNDGKAVLNALQDHLDNFSTDEPDDKALKAYEGPIKRADVEFDDGMEDAEYIGTEHIHLNCRKF